MSVSLEQIEGKIVKRIITRAKRELTVNMLVAEDGREIIIRREHSTATNDNVIDALIDKPIKVVGVIDGAIFIAHEISEV
jgi:hypothetical protein